jgi:hypothetical protein
LATDSNKLLDQLRAVIRQEYRPPDDVIDACLTIVAEVIVMTGAENALEGAKAHLDLAVSFQKGLAGDDDPTTPARSK